MYAEIIIMIKHFLAYFLNNNFFLVKYFKKFLFYHKIKKYFYSNKLTSYVTIFLASE